MREGQLDALADDALVLRVDGPTRSGVSSRTKSGVNFGFSRSSGSSTR